MINLFVTASVIEDLNEIKKAAEPFWENLNNNISDAKLLGCFNNVNYLSDYFEQHDLNSDVIIILNTSGGTENLIELIIRKSKSPILILADSKKNSFASSLEAYAYLKEDYPVKIFYSDNDIERISEVGKFSKAVNSLKFINKAHFGLLGNPSDWLLTSKNFSGFGNFQTKFTKLDINILISEVEKIDDDNPKEIAADWNNTFNEILVENTALIDSAKVYLALKKIIKQNEFDVLSVRCFDLLEHNYTACMGLSICNDEGITAGCEGDIPTTFTMMIAQQLSGQPVWMANPSSIDKEKNQIIFAHCSVPKSFLHSVKEAGLTTHMESGLSTAIRGPLYKKNVTILRISNDFKKIAVVKGRITQTDMKDAQLCRTQAVIEIENNVEKWIENTFGNHHVIVYGDITPELKYFCDFADVELIEL